MDLYCVLNIDKSADNDCIGQAYRKLVLRYHPDKNSDFDSTDEFLRIHMAYKILTDSEKRKVYDKSLEISQARQKISSERKRIFDSLVVKENEVKERSYRGKKNVFFLKISREACDLNFINGLVGHYRSFLGLNVENDVIVMSFSDKIDAICFSKEMNSHFSEVPSSEIVKLESHILGKLRSLSG